MIKNFIRKLINIFELPLFLLQKNFYYSNIDPIIIISANRSGSTVLHDILAQHHELRSLGDKRNIRKKEKDHAPGWDYPIWKIFDPVFGDHFNKKGEGFIWSHPKYISSFYRDHFFLKKYLYYEIYKKKSKKIPIIKNHFFPLRLKIIKKIFPNAKIIFNIRNYKDFIYSNIHKNINDKNYKKSFTNNNPDIGLHWIMINSIALYHLEKYFSNSYYIFKNENLYKTQSELKLEIDKINKFLKLSTFDYNLDAVNISQNFIKKISDDDYSLDIIKEIAKFERSQY